MREKVICRGGGRGEKSTDPYFSPTNNPSDRIKNKGHRKSKERFQKRGKEGEGGGGK